MLCNRLCVAMQRLSKAAVDFLNDFDIDGDGMFSYDEFLLFLVLLSMPLKDMQARSLIIVMCYFLL